MSYKYLHLNLGMCAFVFSTDIDRGVGLAGGACVLVLSCCLVVYSRVIKRMWREACVFMYACVGKGCWEINDMKRLYIPGKCSDP